LLILAAVEFWTTEAITAAAWHRPPYSYTANAISDLGLPGGPIKTNGLIVNSPLAWVMDSGFILSGVLVFTAGLVFLRRQHGKGAVINVVLVIAYVVGVIEIAPFHEYPSSMAPFHGLGAFLAIGGGNALALVTGIRGTAFGMTAWFRRFLIGLGALGFVFLIITLTLAHVVSYAGLLERIAVYPIMVSQVAVGAVVLVRDRRQRRVRIS
jgi:hypothetical membrane protein